MILGRRSLSVATLCLISPVLASLCACLAAGESRPGVIAHRGVILDAPENTLPAIRRAIELGCAMAEIDLRYTSDGEVVLIHDAALDRTTSGSGPVSSQNLAQIRQLDAGAYFGKSFIGTKVPTLREAITLARGKIQLYLDLKEDDPAPVARLVEEMKAGDVVVFRPYTFLAMKRIQSMNRGFRFLLDIGDWVQAPGLMEMLKREFPTASFSSDWKNWNPQMVKEARRLGVQTFVNVLGPHDTIENNRRAIEMGFDFIQTDYPERLLGLIRERRQ